VACRAAEGGSFVVVANHERNQFALVEVEQRVAERLEPDDQLELTLEPGHVYAPDEFEVRRDFEACKEKARACPGVSERRLGGPAGNVSARGGRRRGEVGVTQSGREEQVGMSNMVEEEEDVVREIPSPTPDVEGEVARSAVEAGVSATMCAVVGMVAWEVSRLVYYEVPLALAEPNLEMLWVGAPVLCGVFLLENGSHRDHKPGGCLQVVSLVGLSGAFVVLGVVGGLMFETWAGGAWVTEEGEPVVRVYGARAITLVPGPEGCAVRVLERQGEGWKLRKKVSSARKICDDAKQPRRPPPWPGEDFGKLEQE
jgi:hypothetical protein